MTLPQDDGVGRLADRLDEAAAACRREITRYECAIKKLEETELEFSASANAIRAMRPSDPRIGPQVRAAVEGVTRSIRERVKRQKGTRTAASPGIAKIDIGRRKDGAWVAVIDGTRLELASRLGVVLAELTKAALASPDFVAHAALTARIAARIGQPVTKHSRAQLVYRLVKAFEGKGLDHFIETDPRRGIRLLLQRAQTRPLAASPSCLASAPASRTGARAPAAPERGDLATGRTHRGPRSIVGFGKLRGQEEDEWS